jgi:hypothetical protein
MIYLGDQTKLTIQLPDQQTLTVKTGSRPSARGEGSVSVVWTPEDSIVFAA